jgi:hypothetical protein
MDALSSLRRVIGSALFCTLLTPVAAHAATNCAAAGDSVAAPAGGFVRTLYAVDFEEPTHLAGSFPVEGMGPETVGFYSSWRPNVPEEHKGNPEVVSSQPLLDGQSVEFNAKPVNTDKLDYDDIAFQLGRAADYYTLETDLVIESLTDLNRLVIRFFDAASGNSCALVFTPEKNLYMVGTLATYEMNTRYHLSVVMARETISTSRLHIELTAGGTEVYSGQFLLQQDTPSDFGAIEFQFQDSNVPDTSFAQADNISIKAGYLSAPQMPGSDESGLYELDFQGAPSGRGEYYLEKGFAVFGGIASNTVGDGSGSWAFTLFSRPLITTQLGIPFTLHRLRLGEYSKLFTQPKVVTFVGHKYDGTTVERIFTTDGVIDGLGGAEDQELVTFSEQWSNLEYVTFNDSVTIDKLTVSASTDRDNDGRHDWVDACLPDTANEQAIESTVGKTGTCPKQIATSSSSGGGLSWPLLFIFLGAALLRLRREIIPV